MAGKYQRKGNTGNIYEIINYPEKDGYYLMSDVVDGYAVKISTAEFFERWCQVID